jgi:hypothetical protein
MGCLVSGDLGAKIGKYLGTEPSHRNSGKSHREVPESLDCPEMAWPPKKVKVSWDWNLGSLEPMTHVQNTGFWGE